ncbi:MAG: hypothetical protein ACRED1_06395 [Limisphaerales bacterium]
MPKLLPPRGLIPPTFWEEHSNAVLAGGLLLLALAAAVLWIILRPRPRPVLPPAIVAREILTKCRARPEDGKVLSEVSQALRRYVGLTLEFPPGEFTTSEICGGLERSDQLSPQLKRAICQFLSRCDQRKFSTGVSAGPLDAAGHALEFIALAEDERRCRENARANKNERPI